MKLSAAPLNFISQYHDELTAFRRDLHMHPELGFEETYTASRVRGALKACGVDEIHDGIGKTGVVGVIHGQSRASGRMIGLRADMDALPLSEFNDCAWKSTTPGRMHACGHDGHTAMLIGAARYLAATRRFDGTAVLIFQPGEEGYAGARAMMEDGLFDRFPVQSVYAMHNTPPLPQGVIGLNSGPVMAASDKVTIQIDGRGGHGAHPYQTIDVMVVAAQIITAAQSIVARNVRALDAAVLSLCAMRAGDLEGASVIPGSATLVGTIRTFDPVVQDLMETRLRELCTAIAQAFGATATVTVERGYPAVVNTLDETIFAGNVAEALVGAANVRRNMEPSMGSEDFAFMLQEKPGCYLRIGQGTQANVHNSRYDFNDAILPLGASLHASLAEQSMPLAQAA